MLRVMAVTFLVSACGGTAEEALTTCYQQCHRMVILNCIDAEWPCLRQCEAWDVLGVALQHEACVNP